MTCKDSILPRELPGESWCIELLPFPTRILAVLVPLFSFWYSVLGEKNPISAVRRNGILKNGFFQDLRAAGSRWLAPGPRKRLPAAGRAGTLHNLSVLGRPLHSWPGSAPGLGNLPDELFFLLQNLCPGPSICLMGTSMFRNSSELSQLHIQRTVFFKSSFTLFCNG